MERLSAFTGHWWGESTGYRWIPFTKASSADLWCFLCTHEQSVEQTMELLVIWNAMSVMWRHCNAKFRPVQISAQIAKTPITPTQKCWIDVLWLFRRCFTEICDSVCANACAIHLLEYTKNLWLKPPPSLTIGDTTLRIFSLLTLVAITIFQCTARLFIFVHTCPCRRTCHNDKHSHKKMDNSWWRHQMETFSALLAPLWGETTGVFPSQRPVTWSF